MELPLNFRILDAGTQEYIRDLLRQLNEVRSDLDRARTDQVIIRGQLTSADTKAASKFWNHVFFNDLQFFHSNSFLFLRAGGTSPVSVGHRPSRH